MGVGAGRYRSGQYPMESTLSESRRARGRVVDEVGEFVTYEA
jgi:hypothetical protein